MKLYYFPMPDSFGKEYAGNLAGPYEISEIIKAVSNYDYYLENLTFMAIPLRFEGRDYKDELTIFFDSTPIAFDSNKNPINIVEIPKLGDLLKRNAQVYELKKGEPIPVFIKLFPDRQDIFSQPNEIHNRFCMPLLSVHLGIINPEWNRWIHLIIPSAFWSYNYDPLVSKGFEGWESHYDFICILDEDGKYTIEQGDNYLIRDQDDEDMLLLRKNYEESKFLNEPLSLRVGAKYDWYRKFHERTYFTQNDSEITHVATVDYFGAIIHLFYQAEYNRVIQFAQYS